MPRRWAGSYLLKYSDDVVLKKAIGAMFVAHDDAELSVATDALVFALARPGRFERLARTHVANACSELRRAARKVAGAVGSVAEGELVDQDAQLATLALEARLQRARARVLRLLPLWRLAEAFGAGAGTRMEVPYHQDGWHLVVRMREMGWLRPDAPPRMPRRHCSPDGVTATDEATAAAVRQLCERLAWLA